MDRGDGKVIPSSCFSNSTRDKVDSYNRSMNQPRPYPEWRTDPIGRWRDAFHTFGHLWFSHARDQALQTVPITASAETKALAAKAVDAALYNTLMILEGVVGAGAGAGHVLEFALIARVREKGSPKPSETFEVAPNGEESVCMGFHLWTAGDFRT